MEIDRKASFKGELFIKAFDPKGNLLKDYGKVSEKLITDDYVNYYTDALQGLVSGIGDFRYHDSGTGTTEEKQTQSGLITPTGIARVIGTRGEAAPNIYQTVGLITYDGVYDITEWAVFNGASGNTMQDRAIFTAVPVDNNYQLEFTYLHTALAGG